MNKFTKYSLLTVALGFSAFQNANAQCLSKCVAEFDDENKTCLKNNITYQTCVLEAIRTLDNCAARCSRSANEPLTEKTQH